MVGQTSNNPDDILIKFGHVVLLYLLQMNPDIDLVYWIEINISQGLYYDLSGLVLTGQFF